MMMMVHHDDRGRPFSPDQRRDGGADGPTCNNRPSTTTNNNCIAYDVVCVSGASADSATTSSGGSVLRALQPFQYNISNTGTHHNHNTTAAALRSPGGMATTAALGFPFTNQQWKELERQAMIFKYMMASLPVPRDLLFPTASASQPPLRGGGFNLRLSSSTDPEPGRCKRTDGKKWRCSRDVAPDQKYCERHMHRGRPRSRKHVEIHANQTTAAATATTTIAVKKARRDNNNQAVLSPTLLSPSSAINKSNGYPTQFLGAPVQSFHQSPMFMEKPDRESRSVEWMMKNEHASSSDVQWHDLMQQQSKTGMSSKIPYFEAAHSSVFGQRGEEESFLNLNSYGNFNAAAGDQNHQHDGGDCNLFLNPDVVTMENPLLEETPRSFIDAWSKTVIDENRDGSIPNSSGQLSPSSLTLSMGGYNSINDEMGQTQMSLGGSNGVKPQVSTWLTPTSWVSSPPGGPLAEVLKPTTSAASNPSSPITTTTGNNGEFSSPSCVLNKTLASFSDSSGNSSPKTETVSLWLSHSKA